MQRQKLMQNSPLVASDNIYESFKYDYNQSGQSTANPDCFVGHWGTWHCWTDLTTITLASENTFVRGLNATGSGSQNSKIQLSQTVTKGGPSFSLSLPAGFSISAGSSSATWSSLAYENQLIATTDTGRMSISTILPGASLTISSRSDIYIGGTSYSVSVSNTETP